jgi:DNA-directed RNA polymerase subunit RPC12/RpoP
MKIQSQVKEFEARLKALDNRVNKLLFVFLGIMLILSVGIDRAGLNYSKMSLAFIFLLVGYLAFAIKTSITEKEKVAKEFGVVCSTCGRTPKAFFMVQAIRKKKCPYCGGDINS